MLDAALQEAAASAGLEIAIEDGAIYLSADLVAPATFDLPPASRRLRRPDRLTHFAFAALALLPLHAETGLDAWLRYAPLTSLRLTQYRQDPSRLSFVTRRFPVRRKRASGELIRGTARHDRAARCAWRSRRPAECDRSRNPASTPAQLHLRRALAPESFRLTPCSSGRDIHVIAGADDRGALYGAVRPAAQNRARRAAGAIWMRTQSPRAPVRWVNEWDNLDGSIERGYGGRSIFWDGTARARRSDAASPITARLLASLGINGCSINNVNANPRALASDFIPEIARSPRPLRPWGVRVAIAVDFGSPKTIGGLTRSTRSTRKSPRGGKRKPMSSTAPFPISAAWC